ncbi:ABC transporter permease [candidate division WOR-3 bacterium]|uniref:ABC transporter permease n=1 Tax=candidate division WOR-3 bacterium TaxID=2052148 RepID=A0A938BQR3_UNCW3|nr:ABC transporter permease [candidate division WOR-3 bacterium]
MIWFKLAFKNLIRRKTRSTLTVLGVAIAIAVLYSLFQFQQGYQLRLKGELGALGAHVMVVPKGCPYEAATIALHGGKWPRYMDESLLDKVKADPGVLEAAGVIMDAVFAPDNKNVILLGIDEDYMKLRPAWHINGHWFDSDSSVILGSTSAQEAGVKVGDIWTVPEKNFRLHVVGVLNRTNTQDDGFVFVPRKTLQKISGLEGKLVLILIKAKQVDRTDALVASLKASEVDMNVFPLSELLSTITSLMASTKVFVSTIILIAVILGGVGVLNTVLMAVFERTREIGMMKAMGGSRGDVFKLVWAETILTTGLGGVAGVVIAIFSSRLVEALIRGMIPYAPKGSLIGLSLPTMAMCVVLSLVLGLFAGFYPAFRAASVKPVEAIKAE